MKPIAESLKAAGADAEAIARALHAERRAIGEQFKAMTPQGKLTEIYQRNLQKYGDKLGPSLTGSAPKARVGNRSSNLQHGLEARILASDHGNHLRVVLGDEFDDALRQKLIDVLRRLGALQSRGSTRFVAGSQDLENLDVTIDGRSLRIEVETYVGLSISGSADLVEKVHRLVLQPD